MRRAAALIVGGGPAGSAAAIGLARAGAMPVIIERAPGPRDVVCGGFLGWDALAHLRRLGLDPARLGARPIRRLRLVAGTRVVEADLPGAAAGLSRRALDAALLQIAEAEGATVLRGRAARAVEGHRVRLDDGHEIEADSLFVATGKHELRGTVRDLGAHGVSVGLRATLVPTPKLEHALAATIELHLYDRGYAGLLVQEDGAVNLCLTVAQDRMAGGRAAFLAALMSEAPLLAERIGALPKGWEAIAGVPYGWRARTTKPGIYRVGDQVAVIASFAGDGIAVALASGAAAAQACLHGDGRGARAYQAGFARRAARPVKVAEALRHMAEHRAGRTAMMQLAKIGGLVGLAARLSRIG
ncbi:FAD-dependent monooxygenase [Sphingosinicella sp. LHD-64]|uniref:NAD(P)/FAD-dependent oxidoreductase n=1 Tax=Sphingosinicella sp. LHD-64 TaxID=3072139 RepID=UPI00280E5DA6|nr:FAD-dependent monooxygenase [Sphingosinicella sp. LHD-64]MDQ8755983.1 FAD-dependent monooxygenase [Sphingosinicella sp. LHD-64]